MSSSRRLCDEIRECVLQWVGLISYVWRGYNAYSVYNVGEGKEIKDYEGEVAGRNMTFVRDLRYEKISVLV